LDNERKLSPLARIKLKAVENNWIPGFLLRYRMSQDMKRWERDQTPPFPHLLKQRIVLGYATASKARVFVETGTFYGHMLWACVGKFDKLISIEVEPHFFLRAQKVFANQPGVSVLRGDSGEIVPQILRTLDCSALFWLDAHYSGDVTGRAELETPIRQEIEAILGHHHRHAVLIDDANCFDGTHDYPDLAWIEITARSAGYSVTVANNIIRLIPPEVTPVSCAF
jgi:hypothetical protein